MIIDLPYPPSVNHYWYVSSAGTWLVKPDGKAFRRLVGQYCMIRRARAPEGRLAVTVWLFPPDKRRRDLDNACKALLDSLVHAGVMADDELIDELHIFRRDKVKDGMARVSIQRAQ